MPSDLDILDGTSCSNLGQIQRMVHKSDYQSKVELSDLSDLPSVSGGPYSNVCVCAYLDVDRHECIL